MQPLQVASWSFTASADVACNAKAIREGLHAAHATGARIVVTPECGLTGYPSAARAGLDDLDWALVRAWERELLEEARSLELVAVIGTCQADARGVGNEVLIGGLVDAARYRKRCLTPIDGTHFIAGERALVVEACGWRLGIAICYDLRFGDVWRDLALAGADAFLVCAHMAGPDPDPGTKSRLIPAFCAVRAAETATPLVLANTASADRYLDSGAWDARGAPQGSQAAGLLRATLLHRSQLDPWYAQLRLTALARWRQGAP
jgi:omega-amidase